jgi:hypothetical protein
MNRHHPLKNSSRGSLSAICAAWILSAFFPKPETGFHYREFGRLPVLMDGRFQPFDSVARNSLLQIRTKQSVLLDDGRSASATEWLLTDPEPTGNGRRLENLPH